MEVYKQESLLLKNACSILHMEECKLKLDHEHQVMRMELLLLLFIEWFFFREHTW